MGTGDGVYAYRMAKDHPNRLVIGLDSCFENMREISHKASLKPAKGGLQNIIFGQTALEEAPGELAGLADSVSVILPWGTLLRAVACPDVEALRRLAALCKPKAQVTVLFGYGSQDRRMIDSLNLPDLCGQNRLAHLFQYPYRDAGLEMKFQIVPMELVRQLPSRWAKKLAFSGHDRIFVKAEGQCI